MTEELEICVSAVEHWKIELKRVTHIKLDRNTGVYE